MSEVGSHRRLAPPTLAIIADEEDKRISGRGSCFKPIEGEMGPRTTPTTDATRRLAFYESESGYSAVVGERP
eukprot:scaffold5170_cov51-Phaeocystis_antarctica.AAC.1